MLFIIDLDLIAASDLHHISHILDRKGRYAGTEEAVDCEDWN